jgi:type II secretory pathway component HofQ
MADTKNTKIEQVGKPKTFLHALESFGEIKILASPRILVLNKQRAKVHVGDQLAYLASTPGPTGKTTKVKYIDLGTELRVRPFVSPDGQIRLEAHMEYTTGRVDRLGVPETNTWALTTNVMMRDGATVAIGGPGDVEVKPAADDFTVLNWVPYLNWIPCLDYLLGGMEDAATEKQQIFLFTTHLWKPHGGMLTFAAPAAKL